MKAFVLIPIIVGSALLLTGGIMFGVAFASSRSIEQVSNEYKIEKTFDNIDVSVDISNVEFKIASDGVKKVVCQETTKFVHKIDVDNTILKITTEDQRQWYEKIFNFNMDMKVSVYLPETEYSILKIKSSTGNVDIANGLTFKTADISVSTGNVDASLNVKKELKVTSSTGNVNLESVKAHDVKLTASTGHVHMKKSEVGNSVKVKTSTGHIEFDDVKATSGEYSASTGHVTLANTVFSGNLDIETSTGSVKFDKSDASTIKVKTTTGSVRGTLLTNKIFYATSKTGSVDVPHLTSGGICEVTTDTGSIELKIA